MPHKPQLPESTVAMKDKIIGALTDTFATPDTIRKKLGNAIVSVHLTRLAQFGMVEEKDGKYRKVQVKDNKVSKSAPKNGKKAHTKPKPAAQVVRVTEASVKADLDLALSKGDVTVLGDLMIKVFDNFIHEKSAEFFQLRYMANWCRTKQLSGAYISKAYTLLVGHFMPFVLKLRNGEVDMDTMKSYTVRFTDDAGVPQMTTVQAICPSRAVVEVRKSQRNGFHLEAVKEDK